MKIINMKTISEEIMNRKQTSAWSKGVTEYALELIEEIINETAEKGHDEIEASCFTKSCFTAHMLTQTFEDWVRYSWGGCSLIYNEDIARRLCTPSELKRAEKNGFFRANSREEWLDVQGRALYQAAELIKAAVRKQIAA